MQRIFDVCNQTQVRFRTIPGLGDLINGTVTVEQLRDVNFEDLLGRAPVCLDVDSVRGQHFRAVPDQHGGVAQQPSHVHGTSRQRLRPCVRQELRGRPDAGAPRELLHDLDRGAEPATAEQRARAGDETSVHEHAPPMRRVGAFESEEGGGIHESGRDPTEVASCLVAPRRR